MSSPITKQFVFNGTPDTIAALLTDYGRARISQFDFPYYQPQGDKIYALDAIPDVARLSNGIPFRVVYRGHWMPRDNDEAPGSSFDGIVIDLRPLAGSRTDVQIIRAHPVFAGELAEILRVLGVTDSTPKDLRAALDGEINAIALDGSKTIRERVRQIDNLTESWGWGYRLRDSDLAHLLGSTRSTVHTYRRPSDENESPK